MVFETTASVSISPPSKALSISRRSECSDTGSSIGGSLRQVGSVSIQSSPRFTSSQPMPECNRLANMARDTSSRSFRLASALAKELGASSTDYHFSKGSLQQSNSSFHSALSASNRSAARRLFVVHLHPDDDPDSPPAKGMSSFMAGCLTCNFISMGYLFVPWAFATSGLLLTTVAFLLVMLQSFITCTYVMEACARAQLLATPPDLDTFDLDGVVRQDSSTDIGIERGVERASSTYSTGAFDRVVHDNLPEEQAKGKHRVSDVLEISLDPLMEFTERDLSESEKRIEDNELEAKEQLEYSDNWKDDGGEDGASRNKWWYKTAYTGGDKSRDIEEHRKEDYTKSKQTRLPVIEDKTFELPELSRIFMGEFWRILFTFTTCCDLYGITWSVAAVFASSMASEFSFRENEDDYMIFIAIFAVIAIPLSFVPIVDQVYVQIGFFTTRMLMVLTMFCTTSAAFGSSEAHFGDIQGRRPTAPLANFQTLHLAIQVCIFSTAYQFSVPIMAEASEDKSSIRSIYGGSTGFIAGSVLILSLMLASYFGSEFTEPSSNLNWVVYHGGTGTFDEETGERVDIAWWAFLISKFVVLYPAVDGISTFVLCSVSLGSILMGAWYGKELHDLEDSWTRRILFCVLGTVPQLLGAAFVRDLSVIATYAGLFTVASYTICPCLLQIYSARVLKLGGLDPKTHYSTIFSNEASAWTVAILGLSMIFYAIIGAQVIRNE